MTRYAVAAALALLGCAAPSASGLADQPAPPHALATQAAPIPVEASPVKRAAFEEAMDKVEERQRVFPPASSNVALKGKFTQGGLVFGEAPPGSKVRLDGEDVMASEDGRFVIGFGRDAPSTALLTVTLPDGSIDRIALEIEDREFPVDRIDGVDPSKVDEFTPEQLAKIEDDRKKKEAARAETQALAGWAGGFDWPLKGRISGVFGSQRILNGTPNRPHSGLDIAAPAGTPIRAPADGIVRLAEPDMYFEGGLILVDHGHWLETAVMHLSRLDVASGQRVKKGDVIGAVGATGRATGPHLHWSVRWAGRLVDPQLLLPAEEVAAAPTTAPATE
jgi:hypothetical protein